MGDVAVAAVFALVPRGRFVSVATKVSLRTFAATSPIGGYRLMADMHLWSHDHTPGTK